ncbi:hypothetical protein H7849_19090 [Alloacidobacterium dinghuense]|uniref:Uncharacterized protein n=1 Tax=Alloacidobacterium dinghuense TaxID=2763107 RepID=A0A7G8BF62_9BACT|nr:hypothetical protein [Alloacidobacterium dinghuense]QNI31182.1 hypothetical protein H7849_19090 [Alloacidobacterium dinghuense]
MTNSRKYKWLVALFAVLTVVGMSAQEPRSGSWRAATDGELKALIPPRAPVIQERIETELRTASGITDGKGKFVAGVVLITAGYSAEGKYSHYFIAQVPMKIGNIQLSAGEYLIGWKHNEESLTVNFYEAASGKFLGSVEAVKNASTTRVESFRIWPPADKSLIQIGRFTFPYQLES